MKEVVFVTGNQHKAEKFSSYMGADIAHAPADLDEIQTLDMRELVEHKVKQAYQQIGKPVLVEDVGFSCRALGELPGPFVKFFVDEGVEKICRMLDGFEDRRAKAQCVFGYYDGDDIRYFEGSIEGVIAQNPRGDNGYGFDRAFIPDGFGDRTAAELNEQEYEQYYKTIKPLEGVKRFLQS